MRAPLLLAALLLGGCGGTLEPTEPLAGTYVLTRVDGAGEPLVIADHPFPSGERQRYTLTYDTLRFSSDTAGARRFRLRIEWIGPSAPLPLEVPFAYRTAVRRRGSRVILDYAGGGRPDGGGSSPLNPDTLLVRGTELVRRGSFGVVCSGCPPLRAVEYVYEPR